MSLLRKIKRNIAKGKVGNCHKCGRALRYKSNGNGDKIYFCPKCF